MLVLSLETRIKTRQALEQMIDSIDHWMSHGRRLDGIEPGMFPMAMTLCLCLLQGLINDLVKHAEQSDPERIERAVLPDLVPVRKRPRRLVTVFGERSPSSAVQAALCGHDASGRRRSEVTLDGRVGVFSWLAHERQARAASGSQLLPVICLMDGEHKL